MTPKKFINTDIILIDIVGFSCHSSQEQLSIITYLTKSYIKMLSTLLHNFSGIKVAVHTGEVYPFTDILGHTNYIGDGLNDCARYLQLKNVTAEALITSVDAFEAFVKFLSLHQDFEELMEQRELKRSSLHEFEDKHGKIKSAYLVWLRHSGIINPPNINFNSLLK